MIAPDGEGLAETELPDEAVVCSCNNVDAGTVRAAVTEHGCRTIGQVKDCTTAGTVCGSCVPALTKLLNGELSRAGVTVSDALCEHFAMSRATLYRIVREEGLRTFSEIVAAHGTGRGCAVCRPTVASILSTLRRGHVLEGEQAALQDTNDHVMANLQKNGTCSVIPRMPGARCVRTSSWSSRRSPTTSGSTCVSPAASGSRCSARASTSSRRSGGA